MDGYEALKEIKKINVNIPVIAQTAHAFNEDQDRIQAAGFDSYIAKPLNRLSLLKTINSYLKET